MSIDTMIGTTLAFYVGATTEDQSSYEANSYLTIEGVTSIGAIADTSEDVTFNLLASGRTGHANGAADLGQIAVECAFDPNASTNLQALAAYNNTNTVITFRKQRSGGATTYFQGRLADYGEGDANASAYDSRNFTIRGTTAPLEVIS